ncbi:MAG: hypothetical protein WC679_01120 [Bacteroidales bacterium]|jgi:hypothetical protein
MFKLVSEASVAGFEYAVNMMLDDDWKLHGYTFSHNNEFCQAFYKGKKRTISTRKIISTIQNKPKTTGLGVLTGTIDLVTDEKVVDNQEI